MDRYIDLQTENMTKHHEDAVSLESAFKLEINALNRLVDSHKNIQDVTKKC